MNGEASIYSATNVCSLASSRRKVVTWRHGTSSITCGSTERINNGCNFRLLSTDGARTWQKLVMQEFGRIQQTIVGIMCNDVLDRDGVFFNDYAIPPNADIEKRIRAQGDPRPFNSLEGGLPFPPVPKLSKKKQ